MSTQIGVIRLQQPEVIENRFEVAAWWEFVRVEPGEYPLMANLGSPSGETGDEVYWCHATAPGVRVDEHMPALFAGLPMTEGRRPERINQPATARLLTCSYGYGLAQVIGTANHRWHPTWEFVLDPVWAVVQHRWESSLDSGEWYHGWAIVRRGSETEAIYQASMQVEQAHPDPEVEDLQWGFAPAVPSEAEGPEAVP